MDVNWDTYIRGTVDRFAARYLAYAEAHKQSTAADYDALEAEHSTILAAIDRAFLKKQWGQVRYFAFAVCKPVSGYLGVRGYWSELRTRLEQAVEAVRALGDQQCEATFLHNLAIVAQRMGTEGYAEARHLY